MEQGLRRPSRGARALSELAPEKYKALNKEGLLDALRAVESGQNVRAELATLARLCELTGTGVPERPGAESARETVISLGGAIVLLRLLASEPSAPPSSSRGEPRGGVDVRNDALFMLRELCFTQPGFADSLANHPYAIQRCFELMVCIPCQVPLSTRIRGRVPQCSRRRFHDAGVILDL